MCKRPIFCGGTAQTVSDGAGGIIKCRKKSHDPDWAVAGEADCNLRSLNTEVIIAAADQASENCVYVLANDITCWCQGILNARS